MSTTKVSDFGITIDLSSGWYGEIFRIIDGVADSGPTLHVANTPLILGDDNGYASLARQTMRETDAILCVLNLPSLPNIVTADGIEQVGPRQPWSLKGASEIPFTGVGGAHSSLRKSIRVGERIFDVVAFFGSPTPSSPLRRQLETMLSGLRVDLAPAQPGKRIEQFFSIAAAIQIHDDVRKELWTRDGPHASAEEVAEHASAYPGG